MCELVLLPQRSTIVFHRSFGFFHSPVDILAPACAGVSRSEQKIDRKMTKTEVLGLLTLGEVITIQRPDYIIAAQPYSLCHVVDCHAIHVAVV